MMWLCKLGIHRDRVAWFGATGLGKVCITCWRIKYGNGN
jgi:hypothetical protein